MRFLVVALVGIGCISSHTVVCEDGRVCPTDTECVTIADQPLCVGADQKTACDGMPDATSCTAKNITSGACHGGVCLEVRCGNNFVDPNERCDDGNQVSGDGCSGDCQSNESCGNGVTDGIAFEQCDDGNLISHDGCDSNCKLETASWSNLEIDQFARFQDVEGVAMAYDEAHGVVVMFGGRDFSGLHDETWLWQGTGWMRAPTTSAPSPRQGGAMAYDGARQRIVLFGGLTADGYASDTWEWDGQSWTLHATGESPAPRSNAAMAYDASHKRVLLYGGTPQIDGTWMWKDDQWTRNTSGAEPTTVNPHQTMAYDAKRDKLVLYTGAPEFQTSEYDGDLISGWPEGRWFAITTTAPTASGHTIDSDFALAWDPVLEQVVLHGGVDSTAATVGATFAWDGATWTQLASAAVTRSAHAMATDTRRRRVVAFGGPGSANTTTEWNGTSWVDVTPSVRVGLPHQIATDTSRGVAVMFDETGTTWEFDGVGWARVNASNPPVARPGAALVYDAARHEVVMFGGGDDATVYGDTYRYTSTGWQQRSTTGPSPRRDASMAFDAARGKVVLFGGKPAGASGSELDDTWEWDGTAWQAMTPTHKPAARYQMALVYDPDHHQTLLFGGWQSAPGSAGYDGNTWTWDGTDWMQQPLVPVRPLGRRGPAAAWDPRIHKVVLYGGADSISELFQDSWQWDGTAWSLFPAAELPPNRWAAAMFPDPSGNGLTIFGGLVAGNQPVYETWRLRWQGPTLDEACRDSAADLDGDGQTTCADADCWARCTPACPPGTSCAMPGCGDGVCSAGVEDCWSCPADCGACAVVCGDFRCDAGETCPGDCP